MNYLSIFAFMVKIGLISDTHGYIDEKLFHHLKNVDEIWHAGDIGSIDVIDELRKFKPLRVVHGNIDDHAIRTEAPANLRFKIEQVDVFMTHIGGKPGKYAKPIYEELQNHAPKLFVCGHSHILLVKFDTNFNMLWMNPGACGYKGFHQVKTMLRFAISGDKIHDLEIIELGKRV